MKSKHRWLEPGDTLLEQDEIVSTAYLIVRGIVEGKDAADATTTTTYYTSGDIVGIDALFYQNDLSKSHLNYNVGSGLVELYAIDVILLDALLADEKMSREIYVEIALHTLINNHLPRWKSNHRQLKLLLEEKAIFLKNKSDAMMHLKSNDRLFLLAGTVISFTDPLPSPLFITSDSPTTYHFNASSIGFKWTKEDEINYLPIEHDQETVRLAHSQSILIDTLYPRYSNELIELTPRRQSAQVTPPVRRFSHFQFVPFELGDYDKFSYQLEPPKI